MNPVTIIQQAEIEGVDLFLDSSGNLKAVGDQPVIDRWRPAISEHKLGIVFLLRRAISEPLTLTEQTAVLTWLAHIGEADPALIEQVVNKCRRNVDARAYFLARAREVPVEGYGRTERIAAGTMRASR